MYIKLEHARDRSFSSSLCTQVPSENSTRNLIRIMFLLWVTGTGVCAGPGSAIMRKRRPGGSRRPAELDPGPPTTAFSPREAPRPHGHAGCGTRIIGHELVRSDYFNLASLMGPRGRQNNLDKARWSARNRCRAVPK